jgi:hypothetical protein
MSSPYHPSRRDPTRDSIIIQGGRQAHVVASRSLALSPFSFFFIKSKTLVNESYDLAPVRPCSSAAALGGPRRAHALVSWPCARPAPDLIWHSLLRTKSNHQPHLLTRPPRPVRHASVSALPAARPSSSPRLDHRHHPPNPSPNHSSLPPTAPLQPHPPWQGRTRTPPPRPTTRARSAAPPRPPRGSPSPSAGSSPRTPQ